MLELIKNLNDLSKASIQIFFDRGSLIVENLNPTLALSFPFLKWDERVKKYRGFAQDYREFILALRAQSIPYLDQAKAFNPVELNLYFSLEPRSYQTEALQAWLQKNGYGVVVLPTGAGKTFFAVMAIAHIKRPTLIHVPTIDLMHQWVEVLKKYFNIPIGTWGGGTHQKETITVTTYDSALLHVNHQGNTFGFVIFDECHHLPSEQTKYCALSSLAPFRLGLTATPNEDESREKLLYKLTGSFCYQIHIHELEGKTLAPYDVKTIHVPLNAEELEEYQLSRSVYLNFLKKNGIQFQQGKEVWQEFLRAVARNKNGKEAFSAYRKQKQIAQSAQSKEDYIWQLLHTHSEDRILIFTQDNATAYRIGKKFFLPVLTHHTKIKERERFLSSFRSGEYRILVTSKVLNEGVDVPEASIAIVVSGSGTVREHVQRLGRILRAKEGKKALLYELVSEGTSELYVNQRRRMHSAYQKRTY